jgi:hypothetical protein
VILYHSTMTAAAAVTEIYSTNLKREPFVNFYKFRSECYNEALNTENAILGVSGMLFVILSDADWQDFPGNLLVAEVPAVPAAGANPAVAAIPAQYRPRYDYLTAPPPLAGNAANAVVKERELLLTNKAAISRAYFKLRAKYINSIPDEDISELSHPIYGIGTISLQDIHAHITARYSVLTADDFHTIHTRLRSPKTALQSYAGVASLHRELHATMALAQQPLSELDKCKFYTEALQHDPPGAYATQLYTQMHPLLLHRTFATLVAHVTLHAPNHVTTVATMKLSAALAAPSLPASELSALTSEVAQLRKICNDLRSAKAPAPTKPRQKFYCWVHGSTFHSGDRCKTMLGDPATYTPAHLAAKSATSPPGGSTKA